MNTITASTIAGRLDPAAGHTFRLPVVRELPAKPPDGAGDRTW
jgi:hypothetical protein